MVHVLRICNTWLGFWIIASYGISNVFSKLSLKKLRSTLQTLFFNLECNYTAIQTFEDIQIHKLQPVWTIVSGKICQLRSLRMLSKVSVLSMQWENCSNFSSKVLMWVNTTRIFLVKLVEVGLKTLSKLCKLKLEPRCQVYSWERDF